MTLQRNIKLQPFSPYGYYQLGMTYHHLGRSVEAWKMYEKLTHSSSRSMRRRSSAILSKRSRRQ